MRSAPASSRKSLSDDERFKAERCRGAVARLPVEEADAAGQTDFYGLQALACRAMLEGGECLIRLRPRRRRMACRCPAAPAAGAGSTSPISLEHRSAVRQRRAFRHRVRQPGAARGPTTCTAHTRRTGRLAPDVGPGGMDTVRIDAKEVIHLFACCAQARSGRTVVVAGLVKLNKWLDQLRRRRAGAQRPPRCSRVSSRANPEDNLMGEGASDGDGIALAGLEPGTLQILEPGGDIVLRSG